LTEPNDAGCNLLGRLGVICVDIAMSAQSFRYPQHRTLPRSTETCLVAAFLRPFCKQRAQPPQLPPLKAQKRQVLACPVLY
jgi:hypothetical protein